VNELRVWLLAVGQWGSGGGAVGTLFLGVRHDDCNVVKNSEGQEGLSVDCVGQGVGRARQLTCRMGTTELCLEGEADCE
jgi:hypothetical protein